MESRTEGEKEKSENAHHAFRITDFWTSETVTQRGRERKYCYPSSYLAEASDKFEDGDKGIKKNADRSAPQSLS